MSVIDAERTGIDPLELRRAFGTFVTGVTVVTTREADGTPRGMTANSFTSVSLDPPLVLVCIAKSAATGRVLDTAASFAVNVLHARQKDVALLFASKSAAKFAAIAHDEVHTGAPVLADCLSWFDCTVHKRVDAGDHVVLIGRVQAFGTSPHAPLGFCRGSFVAVEDPLPAGWTPARRMVIGCLVEHDGRILLHDDGAGGWSLPIARRRPGSTSLTLDGMSGLPLVLDGAFLYSIFDVADHDPGYIVYRATFAEDAGGAQPVPEVLRFFAPDELPWERIAVRQVRAMLRRYLHERAEARFGIYIDSTDGGRVAMIEGAPLPWRSLNGVVSETDKR